MPGEASPAYTRSMADTINRKDPPQAPSGPILPRWALETLVQQRLDGRQPCLPRGSGWKATLRLDGDTLFAPWPIQHQQDVPFLIRKNSAFQIGLATANRSTVPPSYLEALHFLDRLYLGRNIANQSLAALATVLLIPSHRTAKWLQLPAFVAGSQSSAPLHLTTTSISRCPEHLAAQLGR